MSQRNVGALDLFLYACVVGVSIRWIATTAGEGPAALPLWGLAILLFSVPLCLVTAELTARFPKEGGVYAWTEQAFGPFWGFLCGWLYWACNLPFFAGLLVFIVNLLAAALGPAGRPLLEEPPLFVAATLALCFGVGLLHGRGLGAGKWLANLGAVANFALLGLLIGCAALLAARRGLSTDFARADYRPPLNANGAILWSTMVFGVAGMESLAFLRNEVRGGLATIFKVLPAALIVQLAYYLAGTFSVLVLLDSAAAGRLSGLSDAILAGLKALGLGALAPLVLVSAVLCILGSYSA